MLLNQLFKLFKKFLVIVLGFQTKQDFTTVYGYTVKIEENNSLWNQQQFRVKVINA